MSDPNLMRNLKSDLVDETMPTLEAESTEIDTKDDALARPGCLGGPRASVQSSGGR